MSAMKKLRSGFTLVEMLVVVGVIAVLISLLLPALSKARQQARQIQCLSNVRQIAGANLLYASDFKGSIPAILYSGANWPSGYQWLVKDNTGIVAGMNGANSSPVGAGVLLSRGYLTDLRILYCPARTDDNWSWDSNSVPQNTRLTSDQTWNPGIWEGGNTAALNGGYICATADSVQAPTAAQAGPMTAQRKCNWGLAHHIGRAAGDTPMVLDICWEVKVGSGWRKDGARRSNHGLGYSCALFDGSAQFLPDPEDIIERSFAQNSTIPGSGDADHTNWSGQVLAKNHDRWTWQPWTGNLGSSPNVTSPVNYGGSTWDSVIPYIEHYYLNWDDERITQNTPDW